MRRERHSHVHAHHVATAAEKLASVSSYGFVGGCGDVLRRDAELVLRAELPLVNLVPHAVVVRVVWTLTDERRHLERSLARSIERDHARFQGVARDVVRVLLVLRHDERNHEQNHKYDASK